MNAPTRPPRGNWLVRLAWLLALWTASVVALGAIALVLKSAMSWVGMTG